MSTQRPSSYTYPAGGVHTIKTSAGAVWHPPHGSGWPEDPHYWFPGGRSRGLLQHPSTQSRSYWSNRHTHLRWGGWQVGCENLYRHRPGPACVPLRFLSIDGGMMALELLVEVGEQDQGSIESRQRPARTTSFWFLSRRRPVQLESDRAACENKLFLAANGRSANWNEVHTRSRSLKNCRRCFGAGRIGRAAGDDGDSLSSVIMLPGRRRTQLLPNEAGETSGKVLAGRGVSIMLLIGTKNELQSGRFECHPGFGLPYQNHRQLIGRKARSFSWWPVAFLRHPQKGQGAGIIRERVAWYEDYRGTFGAEYLNSPRLAPIMSETLCGVPNGAGEMQNTG